MIDSRSPSSLVFLAMMFAASSVLGQGPPFSSPQGPLAVLGKPVLRVTGRHFTDQAGRVVFLRGVNVSGGAKVPPFLPVRDHASLDRLVPLGFNVIRLVFIWEAFEPAPGCYDQDYLARMRGIAEAAWARGLHVIVDIHQDGFARCLSQGCGDGFPLWAISARARAVPPDNGPECARWPILMATDPGMHRSFSDFYADVAGVRTRYLLMLRRVAMAFGEIPGVIGYDLLNEPWGNERRELGPLLHDAALVLRDQDPSAILFIEGHVTTNFGLQTRLRRPEFDNFAYAPHYYKPTTILRNRWSGRTLMIDHAFANMEAKAREWDVPLFVSEFGVPAQATRANDYVSYLYDRLDAALASGAQWNDTPSWNPREKDGWNGEDFSILDQNGQPRNNAPSRPYPRAVAGQPLHFQYQRRSPPLQGSMLEFVWVHRPEQGATELFVPNSLFPSDAVLMVEAPGAKCWRDQNRQLLICLAPFPALVRVRLSAQ
ncbi:MAG: cellulase family glycosylhydrolase [Isosphaeraceae bacterium]